MTYFLFEFCVKKRGYSYIRVVYVGIFSTVTLESPGFQPQSACRVVTLTTVITSRSIRRMMKGHMFPNVFELHENIGLEIMVKDYDNYGSGDSSQQDKRTSFRQMVPFKHLISQSKGPIRKLILLRLSN